MAALVGRIPDPAQRLDILRNLVEEHGEFSARRFHKTTFREFLRSSGCVPEQLDGLALWPCLRPFTSVLTTACAHDPLEVGVACMGINEYAFATCSAAIGAAAVERGRVTAECLVHYNLHAAIDERHAQEFFAVIAPRWAEAQDQYAILQGLEVGAYIIDRLCRDLLRAAVATGEGSGGRSPTFASGLRRSFAMIRSGGDRAGDRAPVGPHGFAGGSTSQP